MGDILRFDLTGIDLGRSLDIAFSNAGARRAATHWGTEPARPVPDVCDSCWHRRGEGDPKLPDQPPRMILFWSDPGPVLLPGAERHKLPAPLGVDGAVVIARSWLDEVHYGPEPDTDGSNERGWRIYNEHWGHVAGPYGFVAIEPVWLTYGK